MPNPQIDSQRLSRRIVANLWLFPAFVFFAFGWSELHSADKGYAIPGFLVGGFFLVIASLTKIGFFASHRGGWPTYVGLFAAFFGLYFLGCALGDTFWGVPPESPAWFAVALPWMVAVPALLFGARRHRRALLLSPGPQDA